MKTTAVMMSVREQRREYFDEGVVYLGGGDEGVVLYAPDLKETVKEMDYDANKSLHEISVHSTVALLMPHSPCFMPIYSTWRCRTARRRQGPDSKRPVPEQTRGVQYATIPYAEQGTLENFILQNHNTPHFEKHMRSIFFQLLHALHVGQTRLKLTHWDLHHENVLIGTTAQTTRTVDLDGSRFKVPTYGLRPMINDYGFASIETVAGLSLTRDYSESIKEKLVGKAAAADFRPFVRGYDQAVLGAYTLDCLLGDGVLDLSDDEKDSFLQGTPVERGKCAYADLMEFLRDGLVPRGVMAETYRNEDLRPHSVGRFYEVLNLTTPAGALSCPFFRKYKKGASANQPATGRWAVEARFEW